MPQPDSGDNCCDCPSRTSPCDDCGGTGACCIDGACSILSADDCNTASGYYWGDGTDCDPSPCPALGCCQCPDGSCETRISADCITPCIFTPGDRFCCDGGGPLGTAVCCNASSPFYQTCCGYDNDTGASWCCDEGYSCCGGFDPNQCCNNLTQQCLHPVDPDTGYIGSFCCPSDWIPCGFEPCCDPETQHCCDVLGGGLICFPIGTPCP